MSAHSLEQALLTLTTRIDGLERRVEALDGLEPRVSVLEAGQLRIERQLDLVFEQGQAVSRRIGDLHRLVEGIHETLQAVAVRTCSRE